MPKIHNLLAIFLILGVVCAETLPTLQPAINLAAYSQENLSPNQSELLLSFLDLRDKSELIAEVYPQDTIFITELEGIPEDISIIMNDISNILPLNYHPDTYLPPPNLYNTSSDQYSISAPIASPIPVQDQPFINNIIPKTNTSLFQAYASGGYAWYQEDNKVIVRFSDSKTFRSFDRLTGEEIDWLQDRLSYDPIDSLNALNNYLNNYHGKIVAETENWVFVKFPSGGFIKIAKPKTELNTIPFLTQE